MDIKKLKTNYEKSCTDYVKAFCVKQGFDYTDVRWVVDDIGGIFSVADYWFNLSDIITDINKICEVGLILKWYDGVLENQPKYINYTSYSSGLRFTDL